MSAGPDETAPKAMSNVRLRYNHHGSRAIHDNKKFILLTSSVYAVA
jgi:hypothetical protein